MRALRDPQAQRTPYVLQSINADVVLNIVGNEPRRIVHGSNTIIVTPYGEGPLLPSGTILSSFNVDAYIADREIPRDDSP